MQSRPYAGHFAPIEPLEPVSAEDAEPFKSAAHARRYPKETKGQDYDATTESNECTEGGACC